MKASAKEIDMSFGKILRGIAKVAIALGLKDKAKDLLSDLIDKAAKKATGDLRKEVAKAKETAVELQDARNLLNK